jgi:hypothetical protein
MVPPAPNHIDLGVGGGDGELPLQFVRFPVVVGIEKSDPLSAGMQNPIVPGT